MVNKMNNSSPTRRPRWPDYALALISCVSLTLLGCTVGFFAESTSPTLLILDHEPLLWFLFLGSGLGLAIHRRWTIATGMLVGWCIFAIILRLPFVPVSSGLERINVPRSVQACAVDQEAMSTAVQVTTWSAGPNADAATILESLNPPPDIAIFPFIGDRAVVEEVAASWNGEAIHIQVQGSQSLGIAVRNGAFLKCRQQETDADSNYWAFRLPSDAEHRAIAALTFVKLHGRGTAPVLALQMEHPRSVRHPTEATRVLHSAGLRLASIIHAIDRSDLIVAGHTDTHGTYRNFLAQVASSGVSQTPGLPTWPGSLANVPTVPLYHSARLWHGSGWLHANSHTQRMTGTAPHLALTSVLQPSS